MDREFRKQEDINCKCQCHYPSNIICHITHCCHCMGNDYINPNERISNNNTIQFSPSYNSQRSFYKNEKEQNNLMNSYSTYYRSGNESINFGNSKLIILITAMLKIIIQGENYKVKNIGNLIYKEIFQTQNLI